MAQTIRSRIEAATKKLKKHGQDHLMRFADQLDPEQKMMLLDDIEKLDLELIDSLIAEYVLDEPEHTLPKEIGPAPVYTVPAPAALAPKYQQACEHGERLIAEHKVAVFTVAGGMGTRLDFDGPKGNFPATPVRNKVLFRVFAESIIATQRRYNCVVPWYIMTSAANHKETVDIFKRNNYFGLPSENVMHFPQGMMPCFDRTGKMLLAEPYSLASSPDGHGGSLRALYINGALQDMAARGIEYISYFQVDNPLVQVVDPLFIGLHALDSAEMSSKAVVKCDPLEKVGNFTLADGHMTVIEYSDLPDELARKRDENGRLMIEWGSIAIHIINRSFVERLNKRGFSLPWHRAIKKVPYIDESGNLIEPEKPNAIKLETFVFDALPLADHSIILEIDRADQFAPIKNASGVDSLQSSHKLQIERAARWLEAAGVDVPRKPNGDIDAQIEISPLFALDADELARKRAQLRPLKPGDIVYLG
ncbi:MAG: UDPGP type 1 family protein [Sedimentisphaerales bacterium]|nr:UDPGP type 1 family protein [Sedimentisphaerales bacterium]